LIDSKNDFQKSYGLMEIISEYLKKFKAITIGGNAAFIAQGKFLFGTFFG
jgi:hypothetical protein